MKLHLTDPEGANLVQSIHLNRLVIGQRAYTSSLIVTPHRIISDWRPTTLIDLTDDDLLAVVDLDPEIVLLGTGEQLQFPDRRVTAPLIRRTLGLEVMTTPAACRTFNILASEGRNVAAALLFQARGHTPDAEVELD